MNSRDTILDLKARMAESIDLYFGPTKPEGAPDANWIQTIDDRSFLVALRIYGTAVEFFDQTWKPDDIVRVR